jgi:hypothetical protein
VIRAENAPFSVSMLVAVLSALDEQISTPGEFRERVAGRLGVIVVEDEARDQPIAHHCACRFVSGPQTLVVRLGRAEFRRVRSSLVGSDLPGWGHRRGHGFELRAPLHSCAGVPTIGDKRGGWGRQARQGRQR